MFASRTKKETSVQPWEKEKLEVPVCLGAEAQVLRFGEQNPSVLSK